MRTWRWLSALTDRYRERVDRKPSRRVAPLPRPPALRQYEGLWVAVVDGAVVAAESTSHRLALKLHEMDHRRRKLATIEYVRPTSDAYIVGMG